MPNVPGQFVVSKGTGNGFSIRRGADGQEIAAIAGITGAAFANSCWDSFGNLYVVSFKSATATYYFQGFLADGTPLWGAGGSVSLVGVGATAALAGMVVVGATLYVAIRLSTPRYLIYRMSGPVFGGGVFFDGQAGGLNIPWFASTTSTDTPINLLAGLKFSTAAVNCMASLGGTYIGIDCPSLGFVILNASLRKPVPIVAKYIGTASASQRSRVVSDGTTYFYCLPAVTSGRVARISASGVILQSSVLDTYTINDLWYDTTGPNSLAVAANKAGASVVILNTSNLAIKLSANPGAINWTEIGSDGKGNWTLWHDSDAGSTIYGLLNTLSASWGPTAVASAIQSGASVNQVPVAAGLNTVTITYPTPGTTITSFADQAITPVTITATDSAGSPTFTYTCAGLPTGLSVNPTSGVITGTPAGGAIGSVSWSVTVQDQTGGSATVPIAGQSPLTWIINAPQNVTVNALDPVTLPNGGAAYVFTLTAQDANTTPALVWSLAGATINPFATAVLSAGSGSLNQTLTVTTGSTTGTYTVTVNVTDTNSAVSGSTEWLVTIQNAHQPTVANPGTLISSRLAPVSQAMAATDRDGTTAFTWGASSLPTGLSIAAGTGKVTGTPTVTGTSTVTATATDTASVAGSVTFLWVITPAVADVITIGSLSNLTLSPGATLNLQLSGSNTDSLPLTWRAAGLPSSFSIDPNAGIISGLAMLAQAATITVTATDETGAFKTANFILSIVGSPPSSATLFSTAQPGTQNLVPIPLAPGVPAQLDFTGGTSLPQGLPLTFTATSLPPGLTLTVPTPNNPRISGTPTQSGNYTVPLTATDGFGATTTLAVPIVVGTPQLNTVTVTNPGDQSSITGAAVSLQIQATDSSSTQTLTFTVTGLPSGLSMTTAGKITGKPTGSQSFVVTVTATDTTGASGSARFNWIVAGEASSPGAAKRTTIGLVVANGEIRRFDSAGTYSITGGAGALRTVAPVFSAPCQNRMFYVDGGNYVYYDAASDSVKTWKATAGTLPIDAFSSPARLIALWNGRIVLAGLPQDGGNWFMSAQLDPFDFDYSPATTTTTQAVAGNNSSAGMIGDVITCLIPYTDDVMVVGCTHSMWQLVGDPMDGGQITNISHSLGVAWGRPFAIDPFGQIYFVGSDRGIYKMVPGALPVNISQQIREALLNIDLTANSIRLVWDMRNVGLALFFTPLDGVSSGTHFFWEERTNSWWPVSLSNAGMEPMAAHAYDDNEPDDQVVMFGCRDGYVRSWSENAASDDGAPIGTSIILGPISTPDLQELLLKDMQATLGAASGPVTWQVFVGETAEAALASPAVAQGTWGAGRNRIEPIRRAGIEVYVKLTATNPWALERIMVTHAAQGRVRRRQP